MGCHCQSDKAFSACCGPFLAGKSLPGTPEELMRSRYSAFCSGNVEYLVATRHASTRQSDEREALARTCQATQWLGLKILETRMDKDFGRVEFVAFYQPSGPDQSGQLHEKSRFIRENGQWYYVDGDMLPPLKFGRNDICWCGSRKKYKKCHGKTHA